MLSEFVTLYELRKSNVLFDKPIIIAFMILELEKFQMNINYDRLKEKFDNNVMLLYTDTESFILLIKKCDPYELKKLGLEDYIDTSNFSTDTVFPLDLRKNVDCFGCLKFEDAECPHFELNSKAAKHTKKKE